MSKIDEIKDKCLGDSSQVFEDLLIEAVKEEISHTNSCQTLELIDLAYKKIKEEYRMSKTIDNGEESNSGREDKRRNRYFAKLLIDVWNDGCKMGTEMAGQGDNWDCNYPTIIDKTITNILSLLSEIVREREEEMVHPEATYGDTPYLSNAVIYGRNELRSELLERIERIEK